MDRNEKEIVYATIRDLVLSFPSLETPPCVEFDYSVEAILAGEFPCVGIQAISESYDKRLDRNSEIYRNFVEGVEYAWSEVGMFSIGCTVALFVSADKTNINPKPFLRSWIQYINKQITKNIRFRTKGDPANESIRLAVSPFPFEQQNKRLYSAKLTVTVTGRMLAAEKTIEQV